MAQKSISLFFVELGFPLRNVRWSWGSQRDNAVLLRTWADEYSEKDHTVGVLRPPAIRRQSVSVGLKERVQQLRALWGGGIAGYAVIAEAKDPGAIPREIKAYRSDAVFSIARLELRPDETIIAILSEAVPTSALDTHARTHRTQAASGIFPVTDVNPHATPQKL
ncbi:MAG: hypothetical protein QM702_08165 [Rubrivivax sp.]